MFPGHSVHYPQSLWNTVLGLRCKFLCRALPVLCVCVCTPLPLHTFIRMPVGGEQAPGEGSWQMCTCACAQML